LLKTFFVSRLSKAIQKENNPEILRGLLEHTLSVLEDRDKLLEKYYKEEELRQQKILSLDDNLCVLQKRMFGKSSEKTPSTDRPKTGESKTIHTESIAPAPIDEELKSYLRSQLMKNLILMIYQKLP